ncbi:hypothetical protein GCM10011510_08110 [Streptococcus himalayensis]|uniref:Uncharacterized protein n=1 Tax=Streptococcus himalayensis TaxID=1888195 RepID=A0A917EEA8_9STRE|nr:hypothetical protein GCM10011510_08110 [Streptococcus himalayensis]
MWAYLFYQDVQLFHHPEQRFSAEIVALEEKIELTNQGKRLFYKTNPQLEPAEVFYQSAPKQRERMLVWGYYLSGLDEIHILANQKPELSGIEEVTAAHELLHAVWARLSDEEKERLGKELRMVYEQVKTASLEERMALYEEEEPGQFENELHSILGTEYGELSPPLEEHYALYFRNRPALVAFRQQYGATFEAMEQQIQQLQLDIQQLKADIDTAQASYETKKEELDAAIAQFNQRAASGGFTSQTEFQAERSYLFSQQEIVEAEGNTINQWIEDYNAKVSALNTLSQKNQEFYQSIREPEKILSSDS